MRRTLAILSVLAALTPTSLSAPAHAAPQESLLLEDGGNTPGWAAYIVTSEGGSYELDWRFPVTRDPIQIGVLHYDGNDNWIGGFYYTSFTYQNSHRVEMNAIPGTPVKVEEVRDAYGFQQSIQVGGPLPGSPGSPVARKFLLWTSGAVEEGWTMKLTGPSTADLARDPETEEPISTSGPAYVYMSKDLGGAANVGVQGSAPPNEQLPNGIGPGARVVAAGSRQFPVSNTLVGGVDQLGQPGAGPGKQAATVDFYTPSGFRKQCHLPALVTNEGPCAFYDAAGPKALGAGNYRLQFSGAGAGPGPFGDLLFWYLDAHLPSLP
jgi:hypothetical protein